MQCCFLLKESVRQGSSSLPLRQTEKLFSLGAVTLIFHTEQLAQGAESWVLA